MRRFLEDRGLKLSVFSEIDCENFIGANEICKRFQIYKLIR